MRVNSYAMYAYSQGRAAPFHCRIIDLSSTRPPKASKFGPVRNSYVKDLLFSENFNEYTQLIHVLQSMKERLNVRAEMATICCKGGCSEGLRTFLDSIRSTFACEALTLRELKHSPSEIVDVTKELNFASITLDYIPNYSPNQSANDRAADLIKAWTVCKASQLEFRLNLREFHVNPLELALVAAASGEAERPSARLTITAIYGMQLIGEDECTADLTSKYKANLAFNRLEEQSDQTATLLLRYRTARPGLLLDLTLTLSRYGNRRFQYSCMKTAVLEWKALGETVEQPNTANRPNVLGIPSDTGIDILRYISRPDIDPLLLVSRAWHRAISKLSDALTLHSIYRCTVRSRGTRSERDVDDLTDVSFYVSLPGRRFLIPRLNIAASEQDFERLRIALAHLRNAKIGEIDLPIEAGFPGLFRSCLDDGYVLNVGSIIIRNSDQLRFAVDSTNATKLVFYDHCCLELILGATSCERQVDLAIQQKTNANFFKVLVARFLSLSNISETRKHVTFPATSFMLHEFCGHKNDDTDTEEVQHRLDGSEVQRCVCHTTRHVNNFTGSELKLLFYAPLHKRYSVKYTEMTVVEAE